MGSPEPPRCILVETCELHDGHEGPCSSVRRHSHDASFMAGYETPPKYKPDVPVPPDGARLHELASAYPFCCMECARERVNQLEQALASEREIVRRLLVLGDYGYPTEHFEKHRDEPGFLSVEWLREYFGDPLPDYIVEALSAAGADAK